MGKNRSGRMAYLDYENRRQEYIDAFLGHLVAWEFAELNLERARS